MKKLALLICLLFAQAAFATGVDVPYRALKTVRTAYSGTNVTTSAWVTIVSSLGNSVRRVDIYDSSTATLLIGEFTTAGCASGGTPIQQWMFGGGASTGQYFTWPVSMASGNCIQYKALSGTASTGENDLNLFQ